MKPKSRKKNILKYRKHWPIKVRKSYKYEIEKVIPIADNVKEANATVDLLNCSSFDSWKKYNDGTTNWIIECCHSSSLDSDTRNWAFELCEKTNRELYDVPIEWTGEHKMKQLSEDAARFLLVKNEETGKLAAFSHFRFDMDYGEEVLYCYELHIVPEAQRRGLGKFLMGLLEALAITYKMSKVILTAIRKNEDSIRFYRKCNFEEDRTSPVNEFYLILSKYVS